MSYYPDHVYLQSESASDSPPPRPPPDRFCSVKGCAKRLPPDYALKMCELCRGRHRVYATTKRAKRKMEKLAVINNNANNDAAAEPPSVAWMPPEPTPSLPQPSSSRYDPPDEYVTHVWSTQIDPRLFNPTSSELAGALTLPPINPPSASNDADADSQTASTSKLPPPSASGLPPRYCSVKGCKAIISGDYLFKMCESCRDRYRNYGNTKRTKWKRERESAMAELERLRQAEDRRRAEAGLPPISELPAAERRAWEGNIIPGMPEPEGIDAARPVRMCTVSHCHTVLPPNYEYRRCEQHRLQNRHHSKLKRVRDKESKLVPIDDGRQYSSQSRGDGDDDDETRDGSEPPSEGDNPQENERPSIVGIPPAARGLRRSNHVCTIKWCHNLLDPSSPWKMCEAHREKDRAARRRKAERDREIQREQEESGGMVFVNTTPTREGSEVAGETERQQEGTPENGDDDRFERTGSAEQQMVIFMDPLLPPEFEKPTGPQTTEAAAAQVAKASEPAPPKKRMRLNNDQPVKRRLKAIKLPEKTVATGSTVSPDPVTNEIASGSSVPTVMPETRSTTPEVDPQQELQESEPALPARSVSPSRTTPAPVASTPPPTASASTTTAAEPASTSVPAATTNSASDGATVGTSNTAHMQPQYQVPYYMPPPFSMSYPLTQPPYFTPSPFPVPYSYHAFQPSPFAPPPPPHGFVYPGSGGAWSVFGAPGLGVMGGGGGSAPSSTGPPRTETKKRKRPSRAKEKDPGLKIVMVAPGPSPASPAPMGSLSDPSGMVQEKTLYWVETQTQQNPTLPRGRTRWSPSTAPPTTFVAATFPSSFASGTFVPTSATVPVTVSAPAYALASTSAVVSAPVQARAAASTYTSTPAAPTYMSTPATTSASAPASVAQDTSVAVSAPTSTAAAPQQAQEAAPSPVARKCGSAECHRTIPASAQGTICEHCRARIKRRQEKVKMRHRLEPRRLIGKKGLAV